MTIDQLKKENERLSNELEQYRQRELTDLRQLLAEAVVAKDHYRTEAARLSEAAKGLVADYEKQVAELRNQLNEQANRSAHVNRFGARADSN